MMAISWYPLQIGQKITADMLNEMIASIQDGSIFTSAAFVSDLVTTLDARVDALEAQVSTLNAVAHSLSIREQFTLANAQSTIILNHVPDLDSELLFINGTCLAKSGYPVGYSADYSISGNTITLTNELALQIIAGDLLVVVYRYEA
jgi:hypothetical protein